MTTALPSIRAPRLFDLLQVALLGAIWGSAFLAIKVSVSETGPLWLVLIRVTIAFVPIGLFTLWRGDRPPGTLRDWWLIVAMSLLNTVGPFFLISWAELHIPAGVTSLMMGIGPMVSMIAAHFTTPDDRFTGNKLWGMVFGFFGLGFVVIPGLGAGSGFDLVAYGAVWLGMVCYVIAGTLIRFVRTTSVPMMTTINMGVAVLTVLPFVALEGHGLPEMSATGALAAAYLGLVCTGLAYLLRTHIVVTIGQTYMSMASYFMPIVGVLLAALLLDEPLTWQVAVALISVTAGFAIAKRKSVRASAGDGARRSAR